MSSKNRSRLVWALVFLAFLLRMGLGLGAYYFLPQVGTGSETQQAGYLFYDAYRRDSQAWDLARSASSLMRAFAGEYESDQYGGLLWLSAATYRLLGGHQPLAVILLAALAGSLGGIFVYQTSRRLLGEKIALLACGIFLFSPESILQGASQMREPFLMTFVAIFFHGLFPHKPGNPAGARLGEQMAWFWRLLSLAGMLTFSPGIALLALLGAGGWFYFSGGERKWSWKVILAAAGVFALALVILSLSWDSLVSARSGPLGVLGSWARETIHWNKYILERSSGIVQLLFEHLPGWLSLPFVAVYGILQPVLPAALIEPGVPFWQAMGIFRALGWYLLLPFVAFSVFSVWTLPEPGQRRQWAWLSALVWTWVVIASLRGGGDQWDNPRYRIILLPWMAMLAAQAFYALRSPARRWFWRIVTVLGIILVVFGHWYSFRYLQIGFNLGIRNTLAVALSLSILLIAVDWLWERFSKRC